MDCKSKLVFTCLTCCTYLTYLTSLNKSFTVKLGSSKLGYKEVIFFAIIILDPNPSLLQKWPGFSKILSLTFPHLFPLVKTQVLNICLTSSYFFTCLKYFFITLTLPLLIQPSLTLSNPTLPHLTLPNSTQPYLTQPNPTLPKIT